MEFVIENGRVRMNEEGFEEMNKRIPRDGEKAFYEALDKIAKLEMVDRKLLQEIEEAFIEATADTIDGAFDQGFKEGMKYIVA